MSQLLGKFDFGIAGKPGRRLDAGIEVVVQLSHDGPNDP
jgi:hypothetical protein